MTGWTEAEWMALLPHFAPACVVSRQDRTIAGPPRTSRRDRPYASCPLPTTADTRRCILPDWQPHPLQEVPGQRLGMSQAHANTGMHLRHPVWNQALEAQARRPARTANDVTARLTTPRLTPRLPPPLFSGGDRTTPPTSERPGGAASV